MDDRVDPVVQENPSFEAQALPDIEPPPEPVTAPVECAEEATPPPDNLSGKTVYVIDANSLIFQVFHAIPEMTSPRGEPVSAVFGFTRDIMFLLDEKKPDYLFVAFDRSEPTFRHELFEAYKGQRSDMPDDLKPQFPAIKRMLNAFNIPIIDCPGFEADDVLATIAVQTERLEGDCYLVTADKDVRQLISDRVKVYNVRKDQVYDASALAADWGIRPDQVVDFQSLVGDSVDNVPGVPLIGPKIAAELLGKFDTLDSLLERVNELPKGKRKENLQNFREQALLSRSLVRLSTEVPVPVDWSGGRVGGINQQEAVELFKEFGFHSLAQKVGALPSEPTEAVWTANYQTVDTPEKLAAFLADLRQQSIFSFDTETTHLQPRWAELVGMSFSWRDGEAYYLPLRTPAGQSRLDESTALAALKPILEDPRVLKVGQNLKYDVIVLRSAGIDMQGLHFDTMIASYLLDAGERNHNMDELASRYLNHTTIKISELIGAGREQKRMDQVDVERVTQYAGEDADVVWRLFPILRDRLREVGLDELNATLEMPLVTILADLEHAGIRVDVARLQQLSTRYGEVLGRLEKEIYELAGHEFNIGSPKQLQQVLFDEQKLPMMKRTKTGGSTDVEVLEELARRHPLPAKIIEYRQYAKLKNTYVDSLPELVHPQTGRVHTSFNQVVAATGRLSSNDPNLQNIPIRTQSGREIRSAFLPGQDAWKLLAADYSQIELRVLAHFSGDSTLRDAFANDEDVHALVASQVYGVPQTEVTSDMRRGAKAVNFGVIYGQSPFGLAKQLNIEQAEAAKFINAYFDRYQGVEEFLQRILEDCQRCGYVNTILGRRRAIRGIRSGAGRQRNLPERTAINTVIQGSAADLIKLAMIRIQNRLRQESFAATMLLQIHDELVFEVPSEELAPLAQLVAKEMAGVLPLDVPLKVDVKVGSNWSDVETLD